MGKVKPKWSLIPDHRGPMCFCSSPGTQEVSKPHIQGLEALWVLGLGENTPSLHPLGFSRLGFCFTLVFLYTCIKGDAWETESKATPASQCRRRGQKYPSSQSTWHIFLGHHVYGSCPVGSGRGLGMDPATLIIPSFNVSIWIPNWKQ